MKVQTDLRAGGHRCGGSKGCGRTSYALFSYNEILSHIRVDHNDVDILSGNVVVVEV
jgi:hypothetical protein